MNNREKIIELFGQMLDERLDKLRAFAALEPKPGTIWRAVDPPSDAGHPAPLVLIVEAYSPEETGEDEERFSVVRVRSGLEWATAEDAILTPQVTGLDFVALVCCADVFPMTRAGLAACMGELSEAVCNDVLSFCESFGASARDAAPLDVDFFADAETGVSLIRSGGLATGTPVDGPEDPRSLEIARLIRERGYLLGFLLESDDWEDEPADSIAIPAEDHPGEAIVIDLGFGEEEEEEERPRGEASRSLVALAADTVQDSADRPDAKELETRLRLLERRDLVEFLADEHDQVHIVVDDAPRLSRISFDQEGFVLKETVIPGVYLVQGLSTLDFFELYNEASQLVLQP